MNDRTRKRRIIRDWWGQHFLGAETIVAFAIGAGIGLWVFVFDGAGTMDDLIAGQRSTLYGTVTSVSATMLGFVLAIAAIVLSFGDSDRFRLLRDSAHYPTLWRTFISSIRVLFFSTIVALAALLVDRDPPDEQHLMMVVAAFALVWALLRIARTVWALEGIIGIATTPVADDVPPRSGPQC